MLFCTFRCAIFVFFALLNVHLIAAFHHQQVTGFIANIYKTIGYNLIAAAALQGKRQGVVLHIVKQVLGKNAADRSDGQK